MCYSVIIVSYMLYIKIKWELLNTVSRGYSNSQYIFLSMSGTSWFFAVDDFALCLCFYHDHITYHHYLVEP
jgi:hypothetical protein